MESIIRSARMADGSSRVLGQRPAETPKVAAVEPPAPPAPPSREEVLAALRDEVEAELRREMAEELARAYAAEREKGREKGLAEGHAAGMERAAEELDKQRAELASAARSLADALQDKTDQALAGLQDNIAALCFEAVCRVLGTQAASREGIRGIVGQVLAEIHAHGALTVRLHPDDLRRLRSEDAADAFHMPGRHIEFVADDSLTHGGCIVDTPAGRFDGALDIQLKRLHQALMLARSQEDSNDA